VSAITTRNPFQSPISEIRRTKASVAANSACANHVDPLFYVANVAQEPEITSALQALDAMAGKIWAGYMAAQYATSMHVSVGYFGESIYSKGFGVSTTVITD
jgi:hypothetical protein